MALVILTGQIGHYHDARYRGLASTNVKFSVLATRSDADFPELLASNKATYAVRWLFEGLAEYHHARAANKIWSVVQAHLSDLDPSVVAVAGWASPESFAAIAWARTYRRRVVMLSESQQFDTVRSTIREKIKARVVGLCDAALVGGPSHQDYIEWLGMPRPQIFLGYDAVDNQHFYLGAEAARADDEARRTFLGMPTRYLLASARFIPKKNLLRLITAYGKTLKCRKEAPDLVILGDGPERGAVEATIAREGLKGRVHLPGFRGYSDLPAIYGLSEGFVHVSTSEQWGLVINEAAASGVPVMASSACGATASLVEDGVSGFIVNGEDEKSIVRGLKRLIDMDILGRSKMGKAAQLRVAAWGPARFAEGLLSAYYAAKVNLQRGLQPWDEFLLRTLSRSSIDNTQ